MKNFFKVLSLAVVAAFVLASCQKEEGIVQPVQDATEVQMKNMPIISYEDQFGELPPMARKKMVPDPVTVYCQFYKYSFGTLNPDGDAVPCSAVITSTGQLWLTEPFMDTRFFTNSKLRNDVPFVTYSDVEQLEDAIAAGRFRFLTGPGRFGIDDDDPNGVDLINPRIPTMADVDALVQYVGNMQQLWYPKVLDMQQLGWYSTEIQPATWGGIGRDCMIWLKEDPSWPVPSGYTKSAYPYTILRSCDYITGMGDNYTYFSIANDYSYYNVRLVMNFE